MLQADPRDHEKLIAPLFRAPGIRFKLAVLTLLAVIGFGGYMYLRQLIYGLGETGMGRPVYWGIYMVNFIFLIGISMAGTLISAVLQLLKVDWRSPITRLAETLTVFGLVVATLQIFLDMGHPERGLIYIFIYGRLQSPLLWDATSLTIYLLTSSFALYLQLLPDIALLRDQFPPHGPAWQRLLYRLLSMNWHGSGEQWRRLEKAVTTISIIIIPIGVSLHTVTSWIFSTTVQPGWNSTILGPYFVVGAVFSGIGLLLMIMALARGLLHLENYLSLQQFRSLGWLFAVMNIVWFYFTYTEHLTVAAEQTSQEFPVLASKLWGEFSPEFWIMVILMLTAFWVLIVPKLVPQGARRLAIFRPQFGLASAGAAAITLFLLSSPVPMPISAGLAEVHNRTFTWMMLFFFLFWMGLGFSTWLKDRLVAASVIAGACVVAAMWLERWLIVVPVMTHPRLIPYGWYSPTLTEASLTAASAALFALMVLVFFRLFPIISIWEVAEQRAHEAGQMDETVSTPEPDPGAVRHHWGPQANRG